MLPYGWFGLIPLEHREIEQISFCGKKFVLRRNLIFLELGFKLGDDFLGIAHLLHCDPLCEIWERIIELWSSFCIFLVLALFCPESSVRAVLGAQVRSACALALPSVRIGVWYVRASVPVQNTCRVLWLKHRRRPVVRRSGVQLHRPRLFPCCLPAHSVLSHPVRLDLSAESAGIQQCFSLTTNQQLHFGNQVRR
jgi:hypothetical protein